MTGTHHNRVKSKSKHGCRACEIYIVVLAGQCWLTLAPLQTETLFKYDCRTVTIWIFSANFLCWKPFLLLLAWLLAVHCQSHEVFWKLLREPLSQTHHYGVNSSDANTSQHGYHQLHHHGHVNGHTVALLHSCRQRHKEYDEVNKNTGKEADVRFLLSCFKRQIFIYERSGNFNAPWDFRTLANWQTLCSSSL